MLQRMKAQREFQTSQLARLHSESGGSLQAAYDSLVRIHGSDPLLSTDVGELVSAFRAETLPTTSVERQQQDVRPMEDSTSAEAPEVEREVDFPLSPLFEEMDDVTQQPQQPSSSAPLLSIPIFPNVSVAGDALQELPGKEVSQGTNDDSDSDTLVGDYEVIDDSVLDD